jgi:hypothetical protein
MMGGFSAGNMALTSCFAIEFLAKHVMSDYSEVALAAPQALDGFLKP